MPLGGALDDDYVASLLLKDAEANKRRTLTEGYISHKPRDKNAPKPNTRFLKNIIRETDSHNAALKAKEEEESKARLKGLGKRRREEDGAEEGSTKRRRGERDGRWASVLSGLGKREIADRRPAGDVSKRDMRRVNGHKHEHREEEDGSEQGLSSRRHRNPSKDRHQRREYLRRDCDSPSRSTSPKKDCRKHHRHHSEEHSDSDPLEDIIGPRPPPKISARGRGAEKSASSNIDTRFSTSYDPTADISLDHHSDRDDWDMALEAVRDRAKWRKQGSERLKAAGFTDEEVKKWEDGGKEKGVEDVRWSKRGEGREWDRGKTLDQQGGIKLVAEWVKGD